MTDGARRALVVSCDRYEDSKLRTLPATSADADAMAGALGNPEIGGFEVEVSKNEEERLVRRRLTAFFRDRRRDDLLVLHLSCHGLKDDEGNLHFATTDTEVDDLDATSIASEFVNRQMARSLSRRIVLLLDCCYSGAFAGGMLSKAGDTLDLKERFDGRGRIVLTASTSMEFAWVENELTGSANPSIFTSALVHGLETGCADRNRDGWITVEELYDYAYERVRQVTPKQTPGQWTFDVQGELYLARSSLKPDPPNLPPELQSAIESPYSKIRLGAVEELARLARGSEAGGAAAAREALEMLQLDDSKSVSEAAGGALVEPPPWTEKPVVSAGPSAFVEPVSPERVPSWVWYLGAAATSLFALGFAFPWDTRGRSWVDRQFSAVGWIADWLSALSPLALVVGAIAGLVLAYRPATRAFGAGLLIGLGLVATGKYGGLLLWLATLTEMRRAASLIVLTLVVAAGCCLVAVGVLLARRAPPERPATRSWSWLVVSLVVVGSALTLLGCVIPFNGGSDEDVAARAIVPGANNEADSWLALDQALVVLAALGALLVTRHSRTIASGILVAVGIASALLWVRYIGIPIAQKNTEGSAAPGGFVGLAGALALTGAGVLLGWPDRGGAARTEPAR